MSPDDFRRIALGMTGAVEGAHMGHPDFRANGRIFATLRQDGQTGMVKLAPAEQQTCVDAHPESFAPETGAWGLSGCTRVQLGPVDEDTLGEAMTLAWQATAAVRATSKPVRPAGYSGTPLAKKLGLKAGTKLFAHKPPSNYRALLAPLPARVTRRSSISPDVDIVHIFTKSKRELAVLLKKAVVNLRANATVWVSWPKQTSKVETDVTEDTIRQVALPLGLVDVKVCAVDEVWSGLKLVIRKERRAGRP